MATTENREQSSGISVQSISTPNGGGALTGIGELFEANEFTGAVGLTIPLPGTTARDFEPELSLSYSSGSGNGPFGLGFSLSLPAITRRTGKGIPRYQVDDHYVLTGSGELVPLDAGWRIVTVESVTYKVVAYAPRAQSEFDVIECWTNEASGESLWRTVDRNNVTSIYGRTAATRISDPSAPKHVYAWLLDTSFDATGNALAVEYLPENTENVADAIYEQGRTQTANKYPGFVRFGNAMPYAPSPYGVTASPPVIWQFELVFDYGQYDPSPANDNPYLPVRSWRSRPDPFSSYSAGFEIRTHRLCHNVLLFHRLAELGAEPVLNQVVRLVYDENKIMSRLVRLDSVGYAYDAAQSSGQRYQTMALPPLEFGYLPFNPAAQSFQPVIDSDGLMPTGVDQGPAYTLVDLFGEGAPGILYADGVSTEYRAPAPPGGLPARFGPSLPLDFFPVQRAVEDSDLRLIDLDGNARLELLVTSEGDAGFYPNVSNGLWGSFRTLHGWPSDFSSPGHSLADLSGTGRADLVTIDREDVGYYPSAGEAGFAPLITRPNKQSVPNPSETNADRILTFADMLGAGTLQMVRIAKGIVECWPSLGYGQFAPRVKLGNAPVFEEDFDAQRLFLADLDGSGTIDLAYFKGDEMRVWFNRSGNSFSDPLVIRLPIDVSSLAQVTFADLGGTGVGSLMLTSSDPEPEVWSYNFCGGRKPYLMSSIRNNLGAETRIEYGSSVTYYLADKLAGHEWITTLPFPVQVAAAVEHYDPISETRSRLTYNYHHGYYDPVEREFRGFGMVESCTSERFAELGRTTPQPSPAGEQDGSHVPPLLTKTWYHTGAWVEGGALEAEYAREYFQGDPDAYVMPASHYEWGMMGTPSPAAQRQGCAALAGRPLRTEVYELDGSLLEALPYKVSETNYLIRLLQPPTLRQYGIFFVHEREGLDADYERSATDPNAHHSLTLEVDAYGNVTLSCAVAYPRRPGHPDSLPAQEELHVTCDRALYINDPGSSVHILGLPCETQAYELAGMSLPDDGYFEFDALSAAVRQALEQDGGTVTAHLYGWERYYYYDADGAEAPLGQTGAQQLSRRQEAALISKTAIDLLFEGVLTPAELDERLSTDGHFTFDALNGYWWQPSLIATYYDAAAFYLSSGVIDPSGARVTYLYDSHYLYIAQTIQTASGLQEQRVLVDEYDYLKMLPLKMTDVNDNVSEVQLDPLGQVFLTSHYGTEGDAMVGFQPILGIVWPQPKDEAELISDPQKFLGGAERFFYYDLFSWMGRIEPTLFSALNVETQPLWSALVAAGYITPEGAILETFRQLKEAVELELPSEFAAIGQQVYAIIAAAPSRVPANWVLVAAQDYPAPGAAEVEPQLQIDYTDGYGRRLQSKIRAEGGDAYMADAGGHLIRADGGAVLTDSVSERWITSGRVRYNNAGLPFKQYPPYFTDTYLYTDDRVLWTAEMAVTLTYDALNRLKRIDLPVGFFWSYRRTAWQEVEFDPCDTVRESSYYRKHMKNGVPVGLEEYASQALLKSALDNNTPTTQVYDNLGRIIAIVVENNATADAAYFVPLGLTPVEAEQLIVYLQSAGFLDFRGALTIAFQPAAPGFSLNLPPEFQPYEAQILNRLESLQNRGVPQASHFAYDIQGNEVWAVDPRLFATWPVAGTGAKNFERRFAFNGVALKTISADAGTRYTLPDFKGRPFFEHNGSNAINYVFDSLGRPSAAQVSGASTNVTTEWTAQRWVYGDALDNGEAVVPDPKRYNLMGAVYRAFDQSGLRQYELYALTGGPMVLKQQLALEYQMPVNWTAANPSPSSPLLSPVVYETKATYDALARVASQTDPAGYTQKLTYQLTGKVATGSLVDPFGGSVNFVESISYNARGQVLFIHYGNGVVATYSYDLLTTNLNGLRALRPDGQQLLQDLVAYRDAVGNLTHLTDHAFTLLFGQQNGAQPGADYDYDALYRLIKAQGQEHVLRGFERDRQGGYEGLEIAYDSGKINPDILTSYTRLFAYDPATNLYAVMHRSPENDWMSEMVVSESSNRAVEAALFGGAADLPTLPAERTAPASEIDHFFDPNGNQTKMLGIDRLDWTYRNQTARVSISSGTESEVEEFFVYDGAGERVRKVAKTPTGTFDVLYLGALQIERALPDGEQPLELRRRIRPTLISLLVAELILEADNAPRFIYQLTDPLRCITFQLSENGQLLTYEGYLPYGGTSFAIVSEQAALDLKQERYSQEERDRATGLYYYGARYLAPWSGRWSSPDPAGTVDSLNLYSFVNANPTTSIDVGGAVKIEIDKTNIEFTNDELLATYYEASEELKTEYSATQLAPTGTARKFDLYEPKERGDLFKLAYQQRGDPLTNKKAESYALKFGNVEATLHQMPREKGVHITTVIGNNDYTGKKPDYAAIEPTQDEKEEARRMLQLMKVKKTPTAKAYNNTMVPVMALSENDRSQIGGLLAMTELYNIKYGKRTFQVAFNNKKDPHFVGAETNGGAKVLKSLDRSYRKMQVKSHQMITRARRARMNSSLELFVTQLHEGRGGQKPSKFLGLKDKTEVLTKVKDTLVKRAGVAAWQQQQRQAAVNANRNNP